MKQNLLYPALLCILVLGLAMAIPQSASAGCQGICERVGPGCKACVDTGKHTGTACDEPSPCFCIYVQCASGQNTASEVVDWTGILDVEPLLPEVASSRVGCTEAEEVAAAPATVES